MPSLPDSRPETVKIFDGLAPAPAQTLIHDWIKSFFILAEDWDQLTTPAQAELLQISDSRALLARLVEFKLLTRYQADRIQKGKLAGLVLGNYRLLDRLGAGAMGVVFKAEHITLRRLAAVKVVSFHGEDDFQQSLRFRAEIRAVAKLQHPNIVGAIDTGTVASSDPDGPTFQYFVMEYLQGLNLFDWIETNGCLSVGQACDLMYQVASALAEAQKHNLVHRDVKPANILVTPEFQAKLLDFGLARNFNRRMTEPGTILGTIDYMAPEQAGDSSTVDIRADIYGLGGTLYWCLTGRVPFEARTSISADLVARLTQPPPSLRKARPDLPVELDQVISRIMALDRNDRYPTPKAVMQALLPFLSTESPRVLTDRVRSQECAVSSHRVHRLLIVDDEADIRKMATIVLQKENLYCEEASDGASALELLATKPYDLMLLDIDLGTMSGLEVLAKLRAMPTAPHLKVIMMSGRVGPDEMARTLEAGADDYLTKPMSVVQLRSHVMSALNLRDAQVRTEELNRELVALARDQERNLQARDKDLFHARNALVLALAMIVEQRTTDRSGHLPRLQRHCRCLAEEASGMTSFTGLIDENFIQMLEAGAPLHDIGKVALPEHILHKPGLFTNEERLIAQTHTTIGADTLAEVARQHGFAQAFFQMAIKIVRHHHERWDGTGYPDRLAGDAIPLAAQIVSLADTYDALRSRRSYRPALSHAAAMQLIGESKGQFNPQLLAVFRTCAERLDQILRELRN